MIRQCKIQQLPFLSCWDFNKSWKLFDRHRPAEQKMKWNVQSEISAIEGQAWTIPWLVPPLCCSRKYPYPSHGGVFSLNPPPAPPEIPFYCHTFLQKIGLLKPPSQLEFPLTFLGVGMDLFWNYTLCCWVAKSPVHSHWGWQIALAIKTLDISLAQLQGH